MILCCYCLLLLTKCGLVFLPCFVMLLYVVENKVSDGLVFRPDFLMILFVVAHKV